MVRDQAAVIGGSLQTTGDLGFLALRNPADGQELARVPRCGPADAEQALDAARQGLAAWRALTPPERARRLWQLADLLRRHRRELVELETLDVGKPLWQSERDLEVCIRYFEYYAGVADKLEGEAIPAVDGIAFTILEPLGVSVQILPWNFPLNVASRGLAPALAAGCSVLCKTSQVAGLSVLRFAELARAVLPPGVFQALSGTGNELGTYLVANPRVDQVTFTGSRAAGGLVLRAASANATPVTAEMGGKSAAIALPDADPRLVAECVLRSFLENAGQSCDALTRLVLVAGATDEIVDRIVDRADQSTIGPGIDNPDVGPVASAEQLATIAAQVQAAVDSGVRQATVARPVPVALKDGYWVRPVVFVDVPPEHSIAQEEVFGPVLSVIRASSVRHAITIANGTAYGLAAAVFSGDLGQALEVAKELRAGQIHVNGIGIGTGVEVPFGGFDASGYGRQKGLAAVAAYTALKAVTVPFRPVGSASELGAQ